jgi:hypothetical protein
LHQEDERPIAASSVRAAFFWLMTEVTVDLAAGTGFLRGEVVDDAAKSWFPG